MELSSQKYSFMVILAGDSGVGKTNIVLRYTKDNIPSNIEPSESFKLFFKSQKINGKKIRLQIWDLAGQQGWEEEAIPRICSKSQGGFIIYDITKRESFENVDKWFRVLRKNLRNSPIILLGNKSDLNEEREVTEEEGKNKAEELNISFYETCASNKENIDDVFKELLKKIIEKTVEYKIEGQKEEGHEEGQEEEDQEEGQKEEGQEEEEEEEDEEKKDGGEEGNDSEEKEKDEEEIETDKATLKENQKKIEEEVNLKIKEKNKKFFEELNKCETINENENKNENKNEKDGCCKCF